MPQEAARNPLPDAPGAGSKPAPEGPGPGVSGGEGGPAAPGLPRPPREDHLALCLQLLVQRHGRNLTREALVAGLPLQDDRLTPRLFVRAAERLGFSARVARRSLGDISPLALPAVLIFRDQSACILEKIHPDGKAEITPPEAGGGTRRLDLAELAQAYTGHVIFIQPLPELEDRLGWAFFGEASDRSWFWRVLFAYRRIYVDVAIASVLINLFVLASPLFIMNVYDRVVPNQAEATLWVMAAGVLTVFLFDFLLRMIRAYFINLAGKRADVILASRIFSHILNLRLQDRPQSSGSFANTVREFETVRDFFSSATMAALLDLPFVFLFLGIIWYLSGPVVVVPFLAVPVIFIMGFLVQGPMRRMVSHHLRESHNRHSVLVETVGQLESIKSLGVQGWAQSRWEEAVATTGRTALQTRLMSSLGMYFTVWIQQMVTVFVVLVGFYQIVDGTMTTGGLVAATILSGRAIAPLGQVAQLLSRLQQSRESLAGVHKVMMLPAERDPRREYLSRPLIRGSITFNDVTFSYPLQKLPAVSGVSFHLEPGERVGLLGRVGSGKSTLHKLILGLYTPQEGNILIDGVEVGQLDPVDLRSKVAYVPQNPVLFAGSIRQNLVAMNPRIEEDDLVRALNLSGLARVVAAHPLGLDMPVGEGGALLSGGQRQLVTLARALIRPCPVILLDEPTASLDNTAEREFVARFMPFVQDKTLIMVTHKLNLLGLVDRIIIMDGGRLVADGPKEEVLAALSRKKAPSGDDRA